MPRPEDSGLSEAAPNPGGLEDAEPRHESGNEEQASPARTSRPRAALVTLALLAVVVIARNLGGYLPQFAAWVEGLGIWGPLVFIGGYALATVLFLPGSILTLAAGAIFGVAHGTAYVLAGATSGAALAFLAARYVARSAVERRLEGNDRFRAIDRAVGSDGRRIVFLLRLSPVFPFNLLNFALGLTRVRFADYLVASIGMIPGTLLYVYSGKVAGDAAALAAGAPEAGSSPTGSLIVGALGLAATIAVTTIVTRTARRALEEATSE